MSGFSLSCAPDRWVVASNTALCFLPGKFLRQLERYRCKAWAKTCCVFCFTATNARKIPSKATTCLLQVFCCYLSYSWRASLSDVTHVILKKFLLRTRHSRTILKTMCNFQGRPIRNNNVSGLQCCYHKITSGPIKCCPSNFQPTTVAISLSLSPLISLRSDFSMDWKL